MISKNDIRTLARRITQRKKRGDWERINPSREWGRGLAVSAVLFIVGASYAGFSFLEQLRSADASPDVSATVEMYNESRMREVVESYRQKEASFRMLQETTVPVATTTATEASTTPVEVLDVE